MRQPRGDERAAFENDLSCMPADCNPVARCVERDHRRLPGGLRKTGTRKRYRRHAHDRRHHRQVQLHQASAAGPRLPHLRGELGPQVGGERCRPGSRLRQVRPDHSVYPAPSWLRESFPRQNRCSSPTGRQMSLKQLRRARSQSP
ncbi:MAG: hypothetical protein MZV64_37055 [Ignavibacteriales bacterium]|nr:hypothetical protein [Ignavibacteriales bacterium]